MATFGSKRSMDQPRAPKGTEQGGQWVSEKARLSEAITKLELARDITPGKWNAARQLELSDLKLEWLRLTDREWHGV